jgi:hypothetical protein
MKKPDAFEKRIISFSKRIIKQVDCKLNFSKQPYPATEKHQFTNLNSFLT